MTWEDADLSAARMYQQVAELHFRFAQALDTNDWKLYRACLDDPVWTHYEGAGLPPVKVAADDWTAFVAAAVAPQQTVHYFTNVVVEPQSDGSVRCRFNHQSCHRVETQGAGEPTSIQYGSYETTVVSREQQWRIRRIHHQVQWVTGNPGLVDPHSPEFEKAFGRVFGNRGPDRVGGQPPSPTAIEENRV